MKHLKILVQLCLKENLSFTSLEYLVWATAYALQVTNCAMHILPCIMLYLQRWKLGEPQNMMNDGQSMEFAFFYSITAYLAWKVANIVLQLVYIEKHPELRTCQRDFFVGKRYNEMPYRYMYNIAIQLGML